MVTTAEVQSVRALPREANQEAIVTELQRWHRAREAAKRHNRNLLQYGAGLTAVLGINIGTGGMLALADSLAETQQEATQLPWWAAAVAALSILAGIFLVVLLVQAFHARQEADRNAEIHLEMLIALAPEWFQPRDV
jgi:Na+/phosphate symporter